MSAPNVDAPNEGIVGQITNSAKNAVNYVTETVKGSVATESKEGNKEIAKGNVPGQDSVSDRAEGLVDAASDKIDEHKHNGAAKVNKEGI
jgi:Ras-related protein Rap-1B